MSQRNRKCVGCPALVYSDNKSGYCRTCLDALVGGSGVPVVSPDAPAPTVEGDREKRRLSDELARLKLRYRESLDLLEQKESDIQAMNVLEQGQSSYEIVPRLGQGRSEGTVVVVLSDWHVEEKVGAEIGGLNTYSLDEAQSRATRCFQAVLRLVTLLQQDITINTMVLALLGDFITGNIHGEENAESNNLMPMHALIQAQNMLISGIDFLLANTKLNFVIPCHSGNHARTTLKTRFGAENGHSLEYLMYMTLAKMYRNEPRITFIIPEGMHSYVTVYDHVIRFHHGHAVKYGGGVGGIYIPVNKAIAQWSKARHADLDVFGHFHQMRDGGNFLCNGSLIGYNAFALSIKADFEKPKQTLFLMDKKRGRTCTWPILVN